MIACLTCHAENADDATQCVSCGAVPTLAPRSDVSGAPTIPPPSMAVSPGGGAGSPIPRMQGRIAGRYEPKNILGRGGMGIVYRAQDHVLNEETAIKVLLPALVGDPKNAERLVREIKTARQITHPNVIRIHDFGLDGDEGYVSMEILPGGSLHERLSRGLIPIAEGLEIAIGICDGLAAAHAKGIIHRDLKPHNVLFDADGRPKIVDFGLARVADMTGQTQGFTGTPLYMSPEMTDGREITTRSDVYSAGVMLFELFTGSPPFKADTLMRLAMLHANEPPPRPSSVRKDVPPALEVILLKALAKDPAQRFTNAREMGDALREFQRTGAAGSITIPISALPSPPRPAPPAPARARSRAATYLIVGGALCATGSIVVWKNLEPPPAATPVAASTTTPASTPTATPTAAADPTKPATPRATAAPTAKREATPRPSPLRTALVRTTPSATPAPTQIASLGLPAQLTVRASIWCKIEIDGAFAADKSVTKSLPAGRHVIGWVCDDGKLRHSHPIVLQAGESREAKLLFDHATGKVTVETK